MINQQFFIRLKINFKFLILLRIPELLKVSRGLKKKKAGSCVRTQPSFIYHVPAWF